MIIRFILFLTVQIYIFCRPVVGVSECPAAEIPENGRAVDSASNASVISYQCDPGFILVGTDKRHCLPNGQWSGSIPICAINVALNKPAMQSSTMIDQGSTFYANFSTDGNFEGVCSSTVEEKIAWWQVDLLEIYKVFAVELMIPPNHRPDSKVVQKIHILTSTTDDFSSKSKTASLCYKHEGDLEINRLHTFICIKETNARYVRIVARNDAVHLCEVVVLSTSVASEWQCPSAKDMQIWGAFNGLCYYGSFETASWFVAKNKCEEIGKGAMLANDVSANVQQFFISQIRRRTEHSGAQIFWIGASNINGHWQWTNGKAVKDHFWVDAAAKDVSTSSLLYGASIAEPFQFKWMPSLQAVWYNWICQSTVKFCSSPKVPANGGLMTTGQMRVIGSTIFYYCDKGYSLAGNGSRTCQENGQWSSAAPACAAVDCGRPEEYFGIRLRFLNETTSFGSVIEQNCTVGQKLIGAQFRSCLVDGKWSEIAGHCEEVDCGIPESIENGKTSFMKNSTSFGAIVEYMCNQGFGLSGASIRHCSEYGRWIPDQLPICADLNSVQSALGTNSASGFQSNLMTGFIVAIIILVIVLVLVVFYVWKKKTLYDTFSMSTVYGTNSQLNIAAPNIGMTTGQQDVLYAYSSTVTTAISAPSSQKGDYYATSLSSSNSTTHYGATNIYDGDGDSTKPFNVGSPDILLTCDTDSSSQFRLNDSAKKREIERVLNDIQLTLPIPRKADSSRTPLSKQFRTIREKASQSLKKSNFVEFVREKWIEDVAPRVGTLKKFPGFSTKIETTTTSAVVVGSEDPERPSSPTLSELFSFDDDDVSSTSKDIGLSDEIYAVVGELRAFQNAMMSGERATDVGVNSNTVVHSQKSEEEKIYDVPPDAAQRLAINMSSSSGLLEEAKMYDVVPADTETVEETAEVAIETVHTYC